MNIFLLVAVIAVLVHSGSLVRAAEGDLKPGKAGAIAQANAAMAAEKFAQAREILERALQAEPGNPYLAYNVGLTYYAEADYDKAQGYFERADLAAEDDGLRALILAQLGNIETHKGKSQLGQNRDLAIDHFRRAYQIYQASLNRDSGQKIAEANQRPAREGLVTLIVGKAESQLASARGVKQAADRIRMLMTTRGDLEEALHLDPKNPKALDLHQSSEGVLVENLTELGTTRLADARTSYDTAVAGGGAGRQGTFNAALVAVRESENAFRDGLAVRPGSDALTKKLDEAVRFSSLILQKLGEQALAESGKQKLPPQAVEKLESAVGLFEEALQADGGNAEAQKLLQDTQGKLAEMFEEQGDAAVAQAEKIDKAKADALHRERADEAYTNAMALNPDDAELQEKREDNALKLAEALEETGDGKLDDGKELLEKSPDKAVATLEDALGDFAKASQLLEEHGEPAAQPKAGMDEAAKLLGEQKPGEGEEAGKGSEPGEEGSKEPGDPAMAAKGEQGSEPGSEPGSQPGSQPGGPSMKSRLATSSEQAMALLQQARAMAAAEAVAESPGDKGGKGTPSYETVAFVAEGSDFNDEAGGGSNEREGNFDTQAMNQPARDW